MKQFIHLLKHDFVLINRNKIIAISLAVTAIYVGIFKGLSSFGDVQQALVLIIFNDPALLGFLFVGVMVLFEKNENTLQALAVTPMKLSHYLLSKTLALTLISVGCCLLMAWAAVGWDFNILQFVIATIFTTVIFSFIGFIVVAGQKTFNTYMLRAVGVIIALCLPFLAYFDLASRWLFILFPTQPVIDLYSMAFSHDLPIVEGIIAYALAIAWTVITYFWALRVSTKNFA
ncbi:MAG: hypothetical protein AB8H47_01875 [Bacteroidia bacterium]